MNLNPSEKRVLIVDDSVDMRTLLKLLLESRGYHAETSSNGEEALCLLNSSTELPDVILLDLRMPVMDGYDFMSRQRQIPKLKNIPVVVISGDEENELTQAQAKLGNILAKPLNIHSLIEAVERNSSLSH